jgi:hypothetical protein
MSYYYDIYNDYPLRCARLWESFNNSAEAINLEVTFMLMCAAGGFVTPFEYLKIQPGQSKNNKDHPAFFNYDEVKYSRSLQAMDKALECLTSNSSLFRDVQLDKCFYARCDSIGLIRDIAETHQPKNFSIQDQKARTLVKLLRNAIAHNNIYAFARGHKRDITELTFFCETASSKGGQKTVIGYELLSMPVEEFRAFLNAWFSLLRQTDSKCYQLKLILANALKDEDERISAYA